MQQEQGQSQPHVEERGEKLFEHLFKKAKTKAEKYLAQAMVLMDKVRREEVGTTEKDVQDIWLKALKKVEEAERHAQSKLDYLKQTTKEKYEHARQFPFVTYEQAVKTAEDMKRTANDIKERIIRSYESAKVEFLRENTGEREEGESGEQPSFSLLLIQYNSYMTKLKPILEKLESTSTKIDDQELESMLEEAKKAKALASAMSDRVTQMLKATDSAISTLSQVSSVPTEDR